MQVRFRYSIHQAISLKQSNKVNKEKHARNQDYENTNNSNN